MLDKNALLAEAHKARERAYAPYSKFAVGAALLCADGSIYLGANIENGAYSPTCCAERVAIHNAVFDGKREFCAIAVVGAPAGERGERCTPCGVCRQVMAEFCGPEFLIITEGESIKLCELLPYAFEL